MNDLFKRMLGVCVIGILTLALSGCSVKMMAINTLGNALADGSSVFARDDDPELVRDAVPFALKTIESLIEQSPKHQGLLRAACSGFTQYSYAFIQQEADFIEAQLRGIVGIEIAIDRLAGKWKASQNRNAADRTGVVAGLGAEGSGEASAMAALVAARTEPEGGS